MKVLFIARPHLYSVPGGDTVQMESTAKYLRKLGVEVDIIGGNENPDYSQYDLLHFFNIIDPEDILGHGLKSSKPYVISTIYVDYSEYDRNYRKDIIGKLSKFISYDAVEYLKTVVKFLFKAEKISTYKYFLRGHKASKKYLLRHAACLLPNSHSEYQRLEKDFGIEKKYFVIPNAIDDEIFSMNEKEEERKYILCVARIEGRKNQLNLIRAMNNKNVNVILVGKSAPNQRDYFEQCKKEAAGNIYFYDQVSQRELAGLYKKAKVHVLASWFETTGLSSLEAAAMGCNIVVSGRGDVKEYFKDMAYYCDPGDVQSIYDAVIKAYHAKTNHILRDEVFEHYTWKHTAEKTLEAYKEVLGIRE